MIPNNYCFAVLYFPENKVIRKILFCKKYYSFIPKKNGFQNNYFTENYGYSVWILIYLRYRDTQLDLIKKHRTVNLNILLMKLMLLSVENLFCLNFVLT